MAVDQLQQTLHEFREQLTQGEEAFQRWNAESRQLDGELSRRLEQLSRRLSTSPSKAQLQIAAMESDSG